MTPPDHPAGDEHGPVDADRDGPPDAHASHPGALAKRPDTPPTGPVLNGVPMRREPIDAVGRLLPPRALRHATGHVVRYLQDSDQARAIRAHATGRAKQLPRATVRTTWAVMRGHLSWARRAVDSATHGPLRRAVRHAEQTGDRDALASAFDRLDAAKTARMTRLQQLPAAIMALTKAAAVVLAVLAVLAGIAAAVLAARGDLGAVLDWIGSVTATTLDVLGVLIPIAAGALPVVWVWAAWREGQRAGTPPQWMLAPDARATGDTEITPDLISRALAHVKITALTRYLKDGGILEFVIGPREQGGGTYAQVRLPLGVVAADLLKPDKVELLAGNLGRHKHEFYPQRDPASDARVLDMWAADKGTMDRPAPAWPLLDEGDVDVFRDEVPFGVTMRSEHVGVSMLQRHWLIGATSKQGKTTVVRLLALGLALDPTVELRIADLKGDGDWTMFAPRATVLIEGQGDENEWATCRMLEDLVEEYKDRYERKRQLGIKGPITRELSRRKGSGFHPIYAIVDECQVLYGAPPPVGGKKDDSRAWKAAKAIHDQARAVNIHLIQATQRPDDRTLPVQVREGAHVRLALYVPNETTARMVLADAVDRGARPQDLRPGLDRGKIVLTGDIDAIPEGQAFLLLQTHYVATEQAYQVIERAMEILTRHGRTVEPTVEIEAQVERDFLTDLEVAMQGEVRTRTTVLLARLAQIDVTYEGWDYQRLTAELGRFPTGQGVDGELVPLAPYKSSGQMCVGAAHVEAAFLWRGEGGTAAIDQA